MKEIFLDTLLDGVRMLPFLLGAYLLIEYMEQRAGGRLRAILTGGGKYGPCGGAVLGILPQCGFSVAAANLYSGRLITMGTLLAIFLSTSDEALVILLADPESRGLVVSLILIKVFIAMAAGFSLDFMDRYRGKKAPLSVAGEHSPLCEHCHCETGVLRAALWHTLRIFAFLLAVSFLLNCLFAYLGEGAVARLFLMGSAFQPLVAAAFGFIPNCAASVFLAQLFLSGSISFGALVAGLCAGAGMGLLVLFKTNKRQTENFRIAGLLYGVSVLCGFVIDFLALS